MFNEVDQLAVNTLRFLSIEAVAEANSGHPGLPLGAAPMTYVLWKNHLKINPKNSQWFDRDRFILSAGHGSALLYSMLHLAGYDVSIDDLKNFRQLGSKTPGHPEVHETEGVETTTGPLGQGLANAVGFAMAEAHLAATYNTDKHAVVDHYTYALVGDGDLQEGISYEAMSLAGHLQLDKLIVLFDSNDIQLDGPTNKAVSEDIEARFKSAGWEHIYVEDGMDLEAIDQAIEQAKQSNKPSIIELKTVIGAGSPLAGTSDVHGAPLDQEQIKETKEALGWEYEEAFHVPAEVYEHFRDVLAQAGQAAEANWQELLADYRKEDAERANQFDAAIKGELPADLESKLPTYSPDEKGLATRASNNEVINALADAVPSLWGGSADLSGSNKTMIKAAGDFGPDNYAGKNIWYGVREHAMASALNGIILHGGTKSYAGTFFVFSDYLRPAVRLAALSHIPAIYVFTHDSIAVGEDGPTHEPVEQLASFRAMHNVNVIRPADANEVSAAWKVAVESTDRPTMLVLTRQNVPNLVGTQELAYEGVDRGGYVLAPQQGNRPDGILIATGSEVELAMNAQEVLREEHDVDVSVVSMPATNRFDEQSDAYKETVLPTKVRKRIAIEMGSSFGWERYVGLDGKILGIDQFGTSGPGDEVVAKYGFTVDQVVQSFLALNED